METRRRAVDENRMMPASEKSPFAAIDKHAHVDYTMLVIHYLTVLGSESSWGRARRPEVDAGGNIMRLAWLTVVVLSLPIFAAADTLVYIGETTNIASEGDATHWDYKYRIDDWHSANTSVWGIVCPVFVPDVDITSPGNWTGTWYASITDEGLNDIQGMSGIVWKYTGNPTSGPSGTFTFKTAEPDSPIKQPYDGSSWGPNLTEYSASPEPGSFALIGLVLCGVVLLRRRTTLGRIDA
jgi:hypothetical protein